VKVNYHQHIALGKRHHKVLASSRTADLPDRKDAKIFIMKSVKAAYDNARMIARTEVLGLLQFINKVAKSCLNVGLAAWVAAPSFQI